ncbi:hypothetical protein [Pelomonas sp. SE-A7]|uniref:hypothetical protein n=1 Tax=Pelomonas sp. SE-A7 TaxID=3054953 RepID=UPI00259C95F4|nr:hypothetical protein [Pelomonas sp. SE-A7]MDM4765473.1 hypothetical protein [Pelomonas sp. SE-A7]
MEPRHFAVITFLTLAAATASAQSSAGLKRIEVQGRAVPVRVACPQLEQQMQDRLAYQWRQLQMGGEFRVDFNLTNGEVQEILVEGKPKAYANEIRRVLRSLDCSGQPHAQNFALQLRVLDDDEVRRGGQQVALLSR